MEDLFKGQMVIYFHPDSPEAGMLGIVREVLPPDEEADRLGWGREVDIKLVNHDDIAAVERDLVVVYAVSADGDVIRPTYEDLRILWDVRYNKGH